MRQFKNVFLAFTLLAVFALPSQATLHVVTCGNINALLGSGTVANGDTIVVEPCGLYAGFTVNGWTDLHFVAAGPTYRGANAEGVLATPAPPVVIDEPGGNCVTITNSVDISLLGFQLQNCGNDGVNVSLSNHVTIEGNVITAAAGAGVAVNGTFNTRVSGNQISKIGGHGMHLTDSTEGLINDNEVLNSGGRGIYIDGALGNHTKVFNNFVETTPSYGIEIADGVSHRVERNTVLAAGLNDYLCSSIAPMTFAGNAGALLDLCGALVY